MTVELVHKCIQQLHLLALHFEILGYIPSLLNGLEYLRRTGDFYGVPLGSKVKYECDTLNILRATLIILRVTLIILRATLNNLRATLNNLRGT